jgi:antitoxin (DNA-binding transcriptional repressor) of toxin-antitoxin stability system
MVIDLVLFMVYYVTMKNMNINEAKTHLSSCLAQVAKGETIVLCKRNKPVAEIRPIKQPVKKKRPIGLAKKEFPSFTIEKSFFEPLPEDIIDAFSK